MDISVEVSGADNVADETVEVVDAVESLGPSSSVAANLMAGEHQLIVSHPQDVLVPSTEVSKAAIYPPLINLILCGILSVKVGEDY